MASGKSGGGCEKAVNALGMAGLAITHPEKRPRTHPSAGLSLVAIFRVEFPSEELISLQRRSTAKIPIIVKPNIMKELTDAIILSCGNAIICFPQLAA
jgi:hypothetical protein